jgi:hypothetical protein
VSVRHRPCIVKVFVPRSDNSMPVRVEFAPRLLGILAPKTALGCAYTWVTDRSTSGEL